MNFRNSLAFMGVVSLLILAAAPTARADSSLFGGFGFPTGEFDEAASTGWTMGGYLTGDVLPIVDVGAIVAYNDFLVGNDAPEVGAAFGSTLNAWEFQVLGQLDLRILRAYLGLGLANYKGADEFLAIKRKNDFAWQLGVAANFFFIEGRLAYHQINADNISANWVSLTVGIMF